ncbi:hypothetical protein SNE40_010046 [Patella caerulea]|uniref:BZIP domain-containing protein n=1 Tax=Patella caerulea TaxID=87958 RepID=A0AAN8PZF2_PATCE
MTDVVLDLSKPSAVVPKLETQESEPVTEFGGSSDSGRASIGSVNSDIPDPRDDRMSGSDDVNSSSPSHRNMHGAFTSGSLPSPGHSSADEDGPRGEPHGDRVAPIRPFKMYPMDPFTLYSNPVMANAAAASAASFNPAGSIPGAGLGQMTASMDSPLGLTLTPLTSHFLQRKRRQDGKELDGLGKKAKPVPVDKKDDSYWERRRKNNDAAKRSRDSRRMKEEEIAMRAAFLEQENLKLRAQVAILKNETTKLHYMLYNRC